MSEQRPIEGLVIKTQSGFFTVQTRRGEIVARVRKRLLHERHETDPVALGDHVLVSVQADGSGMIEEVQPRTRAFIRQKPPAEGRRAERLPDRGKVIIANPDQVVFVFACTQPDPNPGTLDRYLVIAESQHIPAIICANKVDLVGRRAAKELFGIYEAIGYRVIYTSATQRTGLFWLRWALRGKVSALTGPSGVGKSSLLNALQPGLGLAVQEISEATSKGRHTTVSSQMVRLKRGRGYLADTPGIRSIALFNVEPSEIDGYFPEIAPLIPHCQFSDCRHEDEPGCAVLAAVESGDVWVERYESYIRLRDEAEDVYYRC